MLAQCRDHFLLIDGNPLFFCEGLDDHRNLDTGARFLANRLSERQELGPVFQVLRLLFLTDILQPFANLRVDLLFDDVVGQREVEFAEQGLYDFRPELIVVQIRQFLGDDLAPPVCF